jgi:hypothetical protein
MEEIIMRKLFTAMTFSLALGFFPALAQEKRDMPMKGQMPTGESMPMKSQGMQGSGMDVSQMEHMHAKMLEMQKSMGGTMKGQGMMKNEDMKSIGSMMDEMCTMMGDMGHTMESGKMTPEQMSEMSSMMGDMSGMMKQMSERMERGTRK